MGEIGKGIDSPYHLFSCISGILSIHRGALLLPDVSGETYSCWTSKGLDRTTERRLRVPFEQIQLYGNEVSCIRDIQSWKPFFSKREQAFLESFLLCPLTAGTRITGVLLIIESPLMDDQDNTNTLKPLLSEAGELLYRSRYAVLDRFADTSLKECDKANLLTFCESVLDREQRIVMLSLDPLLYVEALAIDADTFRLQEDFQRIFASFVSMRGITCITQGGSVLLLMETSQKVDADMLYHHILSTISSFLTKPPQDMKNFCSITLCPDEVQNPADALNGFFTG